MSQYPHVVKANAYAQQVVSGKIDVCKWVKFACQRQLDDLKRWKNKTEKYYFNKEKAEKICNFIELLPHIKGIWAKKKLKITLEPWQCFIWTTVFGWEKQDRNRRFQEVYAEIPRKNSKSTMGAGVGLYMFAADGEAGSEVYSGATSEKQAWEVFRPARLMTLDSPEFIDHYGIEVNAKNLNILSDASKFEPVIGNPGDGPSPHCSIVDEYHEHDTDALYNTMKTGMGSRLQPIQAVITTAGVNLAGPCYDKRNHIVKILDGTRENDNTFGIIYTIDDEDDWTNFDSWQKANPNLGVSLFEDFLRTQLQEAMQRTSQQNIIQCKHLNRWMNAGTAWMNMLAWQQCADTSLKIEDFKGEPCFAAVDLASKKDLAVKLLLFNRDGDYFAFLKSYLPEDVIMDNPSGEYQRWAREGWITLTPGNVIDYEYIEEDLKEDRSNYEIKEVPYDPFQATQFSVRMFGEGFPMVEVGATVKNFSDPMKEFEALVLSGKFHFDGNPVYTWMISNVVARIDAKDNIYPRKEHESNKIDGPVATIMALNRSLIHRDKKSRYEKSGLTII